MLAVGKQPVGAQRAGGNDDALRSIKLITKVMADAVSETEQAVEATVDYSQGYSAGGDVEEEAPEPGPVASR